MKLKVDRKVASDKATISRISIDGVPECYGIEDEKRTVKVAGETRIPAGMYSVVVRNTGHFHRDYLTKWPDFHKGMLEVSGVRGFTDILIHIGNFETNTEGCLCVGTTPVLDGNLILSVGASTDAYIKLYKKVIKAALLGELTIEYLDSDQVIV